MTSTKPAEPASTQVPDSAGRFGQFGGRYVPETLIRALDQLALEYDPQPPFDSGHMSKASGTTKAAATALLSKESVKPANVKAATILAWDQAIAAARSRRRKRTA